MNTEYNRIWPNGA